MTDKQRFTGHDFPYDRPKIEDTPYDNSYDDVSYVSMEEWRAPLDNWSKQLKRDKRKRLVINIICFIAGMALMYILCL